MYRDDPDEADDRTRSPWPRRVAWGMVGISAFAIFAIQDDEAKRDREHRTALAAQVEGYRATLLAVADRQDEHREMLLSFEYRVFEGLREHQKFVAANHKKMLDAEAKIEELVTSRNRLIRAIMLHPGRVWDAAEVDAIAAGQVDPETLEPATPSSPEPN